ncbi:MAG TPA: GAF domain-containing protein [Anaerolineae bacterium]|nr:GAF domain-containing protein [Anaerolineae bacterium]
MRFHWTIRRRLLSLVISVALPLTIMIVLNAAAEILDVRGAPPEVASAKIAAVIARNVLLSIAVLIVALLMARLIMRRIEPPLQALVEAARAVSDGNDEVRLEPAPDRDLADLARAFNQMIITRKQAMAELAQAAERYRELFENSRDALFVIDLQGRTVDANAAALRLTGYALEDMREIKAFNLVPLDERESARQRLERYRETQGLREIILVTRDGRQVPIEVAITPITSHGQVMLLGAARDISERRQAEERLVRLSQRILTLNEAGLRMQANLDPQAILNIVGDELRHQRFTCLLAVLTDDQESARIQYVSDPEWAQAFRRALDVELIGLTFPLNRPAWQRVVDRQQTLLFEDARLILLPDVPPERQPAVYKVFTQLRLLRAILAPLIVDRRVTAVMAVTGPDVQEVDTPAIAAFARQAAVTLENARLYAEATQKTEEVAALNEIAASISRSLDLPAVLDAVLTQLQRVVDYDSAAVYLDDSRQLVAAAARGYRDEAGALRRTLPRANSYYEYLSSTREPLIVADARLSEEFASTTADTAHSWMGVPLLALGESIGFLSIDKRRRNHFTAEHARRAQAFARIAATAIENARLFDRERRALAELSALAGITEAGLSVLRLDEMLHELIRRVVKSTDAAAGMILLLEDDRLIARAALGLDQAILGRVEKVGHGFSGQVAAQGRALLVTDAQTDPLADNPFIRQAGIKTMLGVPLKAGGHVVGVAHIDFKNVRNVEATEIARFEVMADRAARAIENAQLVERISAYAEELEQRVAERTRDLERAMAKAKEADQLKSQLLSTVSHELRTPLASIKGYVTTLIDYRDRLQEATQAEFLQIIDSEADRLRELVENLLDMSRIEAGVLRIHPEPTRLTPVVERALAALQPKLAGRAVTVDSLDALPDVRIDSTRIQQVLSNLIDNAAKYTPPGRPIAIRVAANDTQVTVGVHDQGPGISPEHAEKIFDRFYRIENAGIRSTGGIGLGLAISRGLVEAHGGRLWVESSAGQGSTFYFSIPVVTDRVASTADGREEAPEAFEAG